MPKDKEKTQESAVDEPKKIKVSENKRRKLEKPLSAQQRDQVMVKVAKEELELKKKNAEILDRTAKGMETMVQTMAQSINNLGEHLGNGLLMLAQAMTNLNQQYQPMNHPYAQFNHGHQPAQCQRHERNLDVSRSDE